MKSTANILVVDDQEIVCRTVKKVLSRRGFEVENAYSADEALKILESRPFDLLLIDVMMPKMNGLDFLKEAREIRPDAHAVMITGYPSIKNAIKAIRLGATDYITKPFSAKELTDIVNKALGEDDDEGMTLTEAVAADRAETEEAAEIGEASTDLIDVDMPYVRDEVEKYTAQGYTDTLTRSDTIDPKLAATPAFCSLGKMECKKFEKTQVDCGEVCPKLERAKKTAAKSSLFSKIKEPIDVDMPFPMDEVEEVTCPEYLMTMHRDFPIVGHWQMAEEEIARQGSDAPKVLVVDDEVTVCRSVRKILSKGGRRQVDTASAPDEAMKKIEAGKYSVVLLDLKLGAYDGLEVLKQIKALRPEQKVVIITGYASLETAVTATKLGAADYLPKPFTSVELRDTVELVAAA